MEKVECTSCQTHRYVWVNAHTLVEGRRREVRALQGAETIDRSTDDHMDLSFHCRRCGREFSLRVTDPEQLPDPAEILSHGDAYQELGYLLGPGQVRPT